MIGLVIITHGGLAKEFVNVATQISGKQENLRTVSVTEDDDMEKKREELLQKVKSVNTGKGVVVLTDMFGGTPSNIALSIAEDKTVDILAGINLPLLIELLSVRDTMNIKDAIVQVTDSGRKYIQTASALLDNIE